LLNTYQDEHIENNFDSMTITCPYAQGESK